MAGAEVRLSVVIVNWNSRADLTVCLESLSRQTYQDLEIIVVDNGSTDGSAAAVRASFPSVVLVEEKKNLGFAHGANRGIAVSHGEWVALLNNDTVADPRWAERLADAAAVAPPECGMLQSVLLFMDRPKQINSTGIVLTSSGSGNDRQEGEPFNHVEKAEIFCPTAGAAAYRRAMLDEIKLPIGYFDDKHFMYFEDLDLGWRARLAGWTAQVVPESIVLHKYQGSAVRHGAQWMIDVSHRNRLRTLIKNASPSFIARTMPRTIEEIARLTRIGGVRAFVDISRVIVESARQRSSVTNIARTSREEVEERWVDREAQPLGPRIQRKGLRLCFVVQRYGREVNGGAELHCRELAEHIATHPEVAEVRVLTTCARSHETWANEYAPGVEDINGVTVERHEVSFPRMLREQERLEEVLESPYVPRSMSLQHAWLVAQGPFSPSLLRRIKSARREADAMIFFTYLYSPTVHGLPGAASRSILIPTAHDERPLQLEVFRKVFAAPRAFAFNTIEERDFVRSRFPVEDIPSDVVGCGVDISPDATLPEAAEHLVAEPYVLFLGRLERGKGLPELLAGFDMFKQRYANDSFEVRGQSVPGSRLRLVLAGTGTWAEIPDRPDIVRAGFVDDQTKAALLARAEVVAVPSRYESLSLVLLESWAARRPAIVSGRCAVTSGMVNRTGGGASFVTPEDFAGALAHLLRSESRRRAAGDAGHKFVRETYSWPAVEQRFLRLVRRVAPSALDEGAWQSLTNA